MNEQKFNFVDQCNQTVPTAIKSKSNIYLDFPIFSSAHKCLFSYNKKTYMHVQKSFRIFDQDNNVLAKTIYDMVLSSSIT